MTKETGRMGYASVIGDQYFVVVGGTKADDIDDYANLVVFDMQKETCTQVEISGRQPSDLINPSACYWKDRQIIVYGGQKKVKGIFSEVGIITLSNTERIVRVTNLYSHEFKSLEGRMDNNRN